MTDERKVEVTVEDTEDEPEPSIEVNVETPDEGPATTEDMQDQQTG